MWPMASSIILSVKDYQEEDCQIPNWSFMSFSSRRGKKNPSVFALFVRTGRRFAYNTFKVADAYTQLINLNYGGGGNFTFKHFKCFAYSDLLYEKHYAKSQGILMQIFPFFECKISLCTVVVKYNFKMLFI